MGKIIRIHHECEGRIEKSVLRIAVWHPEACRVMTNCDPEGRIFLSYPHMNGLIFLLTIKYLILSLKRPQEVPKYTELQLDMMTSL